jgi:uncharacterized protein YoxC
MTITLKISDVLLFIVTAFLCVGTAYLIMTLRKLRATADQMEKAVRQVRELLPKIDRLTEEAADTARSIRRLADSSREVVEDVTSVSAQFREFAEKGLGYVAIIMEPLRKLAAIAAGIQAGLGVFQRLLGRRQADEDGE